MYLLRWIVNSEVRRLHSSKRFDRKTICVLNVIKVLGICNGMRTYADKVSEKKKTDTNKILIVIV